MVEDVSLIDDAYGLLAHRPCHPHRCRDNDTLRLAGCPTNTTLINAL